ncbi:transmembrane 9 superfamily member 1 [Exaiptasia diaphana]|uniref:Transmembrane 9 superfamily member n=1 Tax=Exaiptasia diaphana TaxID=2652724 RepID=A0A913WX57_EXADI|nr:transmembrane 9 superfamily member 1 [Exaiptasia diaphana]KXJ27742.1 Transmembrane 9 superfamily member 1 [Exaiptasia diaphana]
MAAMGHRAFLLLFAMFSCVLLTSGASYKDNERVAMFVNKVGPYFNPQETYHYYSLPVCRPDKVEHRSLTLGEVLKGDRMAVAMYEIRFKENIEKRLLCDVSLNREDLDMIRSAIEDLYYFEFVFDDLPIRGFIGHLEEGQILPHRHKIYLWTHLHFNILYNGDQVISANVTTSGNEPVSLDDVEVPFKVQHTYSVSWKSTSFKYSQRNKLHGGRFFQKNLEIHWLSIINSVVLVFLLLGFIIIIMMRILRNDFAKYNLRDDEEIEDLDSDDCGWKIIHTDVFRFPPYKGTLCAILGVGSQFLALCFGIIFMAIFGMFNVHRHGSMNTAAVLLYALTCCISGFVASSFYRKIGGTKWVWIIILTASLFSVPFFLIWSLANSIAWSYHSTQALPYTTIILLMLIWIIVGFPLTVIGGIFGKNWATSFDAPCRTKNIPREIPPVVWYRQPLTHMAVGGFLPFSAISVELYYIFTTLWGREQYTLYGILLIVFIILLSVTACISIALTYFQLSAEDYRWWWRSIFSAGSCGFFVFGYAIFYYFKRSNMSGFLQTFQFFGYTILACYVFFLMLGTVSFFASLRFIRYIYINLKMD